jgi:hypothetical protein
MRHPSDHQPPPHDVARASGYAPIAVVPIEPGIDEMCHVWTDIGRPSLSVQRHIRADMMTMVKMMGLEPAPRSPLAFRSEVGVGWSLCSHTDTEQGQYDGRSVP